MEKVIHRFIHKKIPSPKAEDFLFFDLEVVFVVAPPSRGKPLGIGFEVVLKVFGCGKVGDTLAFTVELIAPLDKIGGDNATLRAKDLGLDFI